MGGRFSCYNKNVAVSLHSWDVTPAEAQAIQQRLAARVVPRDDTDGVEWIAGADVHYPRKDWARAAALLFQYPGLALEDVVVVEEDVHFPYIPGLLSFRETPAVLRAVEGLSRRPHLLLVDGQGIAHPRRFGIAAHVGVLLDIPTIGCAKSRLWGAAEEPAPEAGAWTPLKDGQEVIGAALRTRAYVKPLYISVGHRVDLAAAMRWVLACCRGYRLPEPNRWAHRAAGGEALKPVRLG